MKYKEYEIAITTTGIKPPRTYQTHDVRVTLRDIRNPNNICWMESPMKEDFEGIYCCPNPDDLKRLIHPVQFIAFINKWHLMIHPRVYEEICAIYIENVYTKRRVYSREYIDGLLDAVENNLDEFPSAIDFATEEELYKAYSGVYAE